MAETIRHPAKFTRTILETVQQIIAREAMHQGRTLSIVDPFAGTGRVHALGNGGHQTVGVEIEPEWAGISDSTIVGDACDLPFPAASFDVCVSSPCYGNRMSDHHDARDASRRNTYRHALGRALTPGNTGAMQWGPEYRRTHEQAMREIVRVVRPGGLIVWNVSNHIRAGVEQRVVEWHVNTWLVLRCRIVEAVRVETPRQRHGENAHLRVDGELVVVLRTPDDDTAVML